MGLFRTAAVDAGRERLQGTVLLLPQIPHTALSLCLLVWVSAVLVFLSEASWSRKVTVRGWLEPSGGFVRVYPDTAGRLARLMVTDGEAVVEGQPLAIIDGDRVLAGGARLEALLLDEFRNQKAALERQLRREESLRITRQRAIEAQLDAGRQELSNLDAQIDTLSARAGLLGRRRSRHEALSLDGHITPAALDELREQALQLASQQQTLAMRRIQKQALVLELESALLRLPREVANSLDRIRLELSRNSQEIARIRSHRARVIAAPRSGTVGNIALHEGQKTRPDKPLMTLSPAGSTLVARLLVPAHAAGFLRRGLEVAMRYDAFPHQKYGMQDGRILQVADSATLPSDYAQLPIAISSPVFRVTAQPGRETLLGSGEEIALRSGMTFSADVILERRSLLQWLLAPLQTLRSGIS